MKHWKAAGRRLALYLDDLLLLGRRRLLCAGGLGSWAGRPAALLVAAGA